MTAHKVLTIYLEITQEKHYHSYKLLYIYVDTHHFSQEEETFQHV